MCIRDREANLKEDLEKAQKEDDLDIEKVAQDDLKEQIKEEIKAELKEEEDKE